MNTDRNDIQRLRTEVDELRAEIQSVRHPKPEAWQSRFGGGRRRLTAAGIAALLLALPIAVSASHTFRDVSTSNTFHTVITRLAESGITGGCGSGRYCPNSAVTRGQMAAFLNRGLGRAAHDDDNLGDHWAALDHGSDQPIAVVTLRTGGGTGGTGHVLVQGNVMAWTRGAGVCPCDLSMWLYSWTGESSVGSSTIIGTVASPDTGDYRGSVSWSHLFTAPSGMDVQYGLVAHIMPTQWPSPSIEADAFYSLQATYIPFDDQGGNPDLPTTTGSQSIPFGTAPVGASVE